MDIAVLRVMIVEAIKSQYNMTVNQFSNSDIPTKIGIKGGNSLRCYLQGNSVSYETFKALCSHFKLGALDREIKVERVITYSLQAPVTPAFPGSPSMRRGSTKKKSITKKKIIRKM